MELELGMAGGNWRTTSKNEGRARKIVVSVVMARSWSVRATETEFESDLGKSKVSDYVNDQC
jgi:hypothetical protein